MTHSNILSFLRLLSTLTVLDDSIHVDLVGWSQSDSVSLSILILTRLVESNLDFGLSRQLIHPSDERELPLLDHHREEGLGCTWPHYPSARIRVTDSILSFETGVG